MVQVPYDSANLQYFGEQSIELLRGNVSVEDEEAVLLKRQEKLDELKGICRFCLCFDPKHESKCVSITKLDDYHIRLDDVLTSLGLSAQPSDIFGEHVCEQCFQQIVEIDLFKKKCREAQEEVLGELDELENKIQEIRRTKVGGKVWYKNETGISPCKNDSQLDTSAMEIFEEHLVDEDEFEDGPKYEFVPQVGEGTEEYIEEIHDGYKIIYQHLPEANTSDEKLFKEIASTEIISMDDTCPPIDIQFMIDGKEETDNKSVVVQGVDEYQMVTTDDIIKNPERNRFCFRIYECFFCKMVSQVDRQVGHWSSN